jgi:exodeoxyribonuclease VII small subunit
MDVEKAPKGKKEPAELSKKAVSQEGEDCARNDASLEGQAFEEILARLQCVVDELEQGDLTLEKALETFEQGIKLARIGSGRLDEAERRVEILLSDQPGVQAFPLDKESETK